jgi:hypothetical protein
MTGSAQIKIGSAWKTATSAQIKIGSVWKPVVGMWIQIGGAWKQAASFTSGPPGAAYNVMDYGAHRNGTTDDSDHIISACNAAVAGGGYVLMPAGANPYRSNGFTVPTGSYIYSADNASIRIVGAISPSNNTTIDGLTCIAYGDDLGIGAGGTVSGATIKNCTFNESGSNKFSWASIIFYQATSCTIYHNTFNGSSAVGSCIQSLGGKNNVVSYNTCVGGVTSIAFLYSRGVNGGGLASIVDNNEVHHNTCSGFSEEGITFDDIGNTAADVACIDTATVTAVGTGTITLTAYGSAYATLTGYDIFPLDGTMQCRPFTITSQSGAKKNVFSVADSTGVTVGDHVTIAALFKNNYIHDNSSDATDYNAIIIYGAAYNNRIENNHVLPGGAISIHSIDNTVAADIGVSGNGGRGPCAYNMIKGNTCDDAGMDMTWVLLADGPSHAAYLAAPFVTKGNNVENNSLHTGLTADEHWFYRTGNSGSETFTNCTLAGAEMT